MEPPLFLEAVENHISRAPSGVYWGPTGHRILLQGRFSLTGKWLNSQSGQTEKWRVPTSHVLNKIRSSFPFSFEWWYRLRWVNAICRAKGNGAGLSILWVERKEVGQTLSLRLYQSGPPRRQLWKSPPSVQSRDWPWSRCILLCDSRNQHRQWR